MLSEFLVQSLQMFDQKRRLMLGGEAFIDVTEDFATEYCESMQEKLQAEMAELENSIKDIEERQKVVCYCMISLSSG